jgi:hypothetical protein
VIARYLDDGTTPDSSSPDTAGRKSTVAGHAAALVLAETRWAMADIDGAPRLSRVGLTAITSAEAAWLLVPWCTTADKLGALWRTAEAKQTIDWPDQAVTKFDIPAHVAYPAVQRARLLLRQGRLDEAAEQATAGLARAEGMGVALAAPVALAVLASVALRQRDTTTAARYVAASRAARQHAVTPPCSLPDWVELQLMMEQCGPERTAELLYGPQAALLWSPALLLEEPSAAAFFVRVGMAVGGDEIAVSAVKVAGRLAQDNPRHPVLAAAAAHARGLYEQSWSTSSRLTSAGNLARSARVAATSSASAHSGCCLAGRPRQVPRSGSVSGGHESGSLTADTDRLVGGRVFSCPDTSPPK